MKQKLTRGKAYPRKCAHCAFGSIVEGDKEVLCTRNGVMQPDDCCSKYQYDPLKRQPKRQTLASGYSEEDFAL